MTQQDDTSKFQDLLGKPKIYAVVQAAKIEIEKHGIVNSKIKDIAKRANVGEATIYRHFADKSELVKLVAYEYLTSKSLQFQEFVQSRVNGTKNGIEQMEVIVDLFLDMYYNHKDLLQFMDDYQNYIATHTKNTPDNIGDYIVSLQKLTFAVIDQGYEDLSIPKSKSKEEIYEFMVLTFLPAIQTLALRKVQTDLNFVEDHNRLLKNMKLSFLLWIQNEAS